MESYVLSIAVAVLVGAVIGFEREYHDKSAGFRTMMLIAVGSCLFTLLSLELGKNADDATRIAAGVVTGVGFLGAGVILKDGTTIRGLTTAAAIWLVASLGMAAASEMYMLVGVVTGTIFAVLWFLPPFERWIDKLHDFAFFTITIKNTATAEEKALALFADAGARVVEVRRERRTKGERVLHVKANMNNAQHDELSTILVSSKAILELHDSK